MPVIVNKYIALMKIGKCENEGPVARLARRKVMKDCTHHSQSGHLLRPSSWSWMEFG